MAGRLDAREREWRTQEDLATLTRAAEITADKGRMSAVQKHAAAQVANLQKVAKPPAKPAAKASTRRKGK